MSFIIVMNFFSILRCVCCCIWRNCLAQKVEVLWVFLIVFLGNFGLGAVEPSEIKAQHSVFIDENDEPFYWVSFARIPTSAHETYGNRGQIEFRGRIKAFQFQNIADGVLNINYSGNLFLFTGRVATDLPDQLFCLAVEPTWTRRFHNGMNLQLKAQPGVYNDMKKWSLSAIFVPLRVVVIKDYSDVFAGLIGIDIRHDFRNKIMPVAGVKWAPVEALRITVGVQEGGIDFFLPNVNFYGKWNWQNISFRKEYASSGEELVTLEDCRLTAGLMIWLKSDMHFFGEVGRVLGREINLGRYSNRPESEIDIEEAQIVRIGIAGPF